MSALLFPAPHVSIVIVMSARLRGGRRETPLDTPMQLDADVPPTPTKSRRSSKDELTAVLYGVSHSPWTQAAALALHLKQIPFRSVSVPFPATWVVEGLTMPVVWIGGRKLCGTAEILRVLDELAPSAVAVSDGSDEPKWRERCEEFFFLYVPGRIDYGAGHFIGHFAHMTSSTVVPAVPLGWDALAHACMQSALRPMSCMYSLSLLTWARFVLGRGVDGAGVARCLDWWEARLGASAEAGPYLRGPRLGEPDLLLYGHLQCVCSSVGSTALVAAELRGGRWPRLLGYTRRLDAALGASGYPWLYTAAALDADMPPAAAAAAAATADASSDALSPPPVLVSRARARTACLAERVAFWFGFCVLTVPLLPLLLLLLLHGFAVRNANRNRSLKSFGNALLPWRVVRRALRRRVVRHCELVSAAIASGRAALERPIQRLRRPPPTRMPPPTTAADAHGRNASPQRSPRSATLGNKRM